MNEEEKLKDALDHIMRVARQSRTMTKRLKFIEMRAQSALENTEDWKNYAYPKNRPVNEARLRFRIKELEEIVETTTSSRFSEFIRNASAEEKAEVFDKVIDRSIELQSRSNT